MSTVQNYLKSDVIDIVPLLSLVLDKTHSQLITQNDYRLSTEEQTALNVFIEQRQQGIPFAYLSGTKGFYHLDFKVTSDTLIPRPETELLVDIILDLFDQNQTITALDLGTGSGVIAIIIADKCPNWQLTATDASNKALKIAQHNAAQQNITNIDFHSGYWFDAVPNQQFDLIVSNPPYIQANDTHLNKLKHEPQNALISGDDGLDDIRTIIKYAPNFLNQQGCLLLEHGFDQQADIQALLAQNFTNIQTFKDYNLQNRAVLAQLKNG